MGEVEQALPSLSVVEEELVVVSTDFEEQVQHVQLLAGELPFEPVHRVKLALGLLVLLAVLVEQSELHQDMDWLLLVGLVGQVA